MSQASTHLWVVLKDLPFSATTCKALRCWPGFHPAKWLPQKVENTIIILIEVDLSSTLYFCFAKTWCRPRPSQSNPEEGVPHLQKQVFSPGKSFCLSNYQMEIKSPFKFLVIDTSGKEEAHSWHRFKVSRVWWVSPSDLHKNDNSRGFQCSIGVIWKPEAQYLLVPHHWRPSWEWWIWYPCSPLRLPSPPWSWRSGS